MLMLPKGSLSVLVICELYFRSTHTVYTFPTLGSENEGDFPAAFFLVMTNTNAIFFFFFKYLRFTQKYLNGQCERRFKYGRTQRDQV